jgi:Rap1a immunity proteins
MRHAIIFVVVLIATSTTWPQGASAIESGAELANYCQSLERGTKGAGKHIRIPNTRQALLCWGYIGAMQDISVLVTAQGRRLIGSCPPEQITLLQLIHRFVTYARSHPSEVQGNTATAVIKMLRVNFPCHQISAAAEQHSAIPR